MMRWVLLLSWDWEGMGADGVVGGVVIIIIVDHHR